MSKTVNCPKQRLTARLKVLRMRVVELNNYDFLPFSNFSAFFAYTFNELVHNAPCSFHVLSLSKRRRNIGSDHVTPSPREHFKTSSLGKIQRSVHLTYNTCCHAATETVPALPTAFPYTFLFLSSRVPAFDSNQTANSFRCLENHPLIRIFYRAIPPAKVPPD